MRFFYRYLFFLIFIPTTFASALKWYVTPDVYSAAWRVGAWANRAVTNANGTQTTYPGKTVWLNSVGLSSTLLFAGNWALTAGGSAGYGSDSIQTSSVVPGTPYTSLCAGFPCTLVPNSVVAITPAVKLWRTEANAALSKALGNSGFTVSLGAKYQNYKFDGTDNGASSVTTTTYTIISNGQQGTLSSTTTAGTYSISSISEAVGGSTGFGYGFRLGTGMQLISQLNFLFLRGKFSETSTSKFGNGAAAPQTMDSYFNGYGFTFLLSLVRPITYSGFLQVSLRGQYYLMQVTRREGSYINTTTNTTDNTTPDPSTSNFHNAADYLGGLQIAYIQQLAGD